MVISTNTWRVILITLLFFGILGGGSIWRLRIVFLSLLFWIILIFVKEKNNNNFSKIEKTIIIFVSLLLIQSKFKTYRIRGPNQKFDFIKDF